MLKRSRGFSLIELMVTLAVLGFILAMGIPSFSTYITNSRVRSVTSEMRDGLQQARMEAIRRNGTVSFCVTADTGTGWSVRTGADCSAGTVLSSRPSSTSEARSVTLNPTSLSVAFGSDGRIRTSSGAAGSGTALTTLEAGWSSSCSGDCVNMRVEISPGGMIRSCNSGLPEGDPQSCAGSGAASSAASSPSTP
ncbi:MAG: GspH/FimT family pseudopilin [Candidatus Dactylopiibacterium sp.]|nr:GspH/FimT family pseudopilin [Candidatus Dactylopiibacterium sp.]